VIFANTKQQPLDQHRKAVALLSAAIPDALDLDFSSIDYDNQKIKNTCYKAGFDHDLGKVLPSFQSYIQSKLKLQDEYETLGECEKYDIENEPTHNEMSYWLAGLKIEAESLKSKSKIDNEAYLYAVLWHHAKVIRKGKKSFSDIVREYLKKGANEASLKTLLKESGELELSKLKKITNPSEFTLDHVGEVFKHPMPEEPSIGSEDLFRKEQRKNVVNTLVRLCVVTADRYISSLSKEELQFFLDENKADEVAKGFLSSGNQSLAKDIEAYLKKHEGSERSKVQKEVAIGLSRLSHSVCSGAPGVGKTRIALQAYVLRQQKFQKKKLIEANKLVWICPRVTVCEGVVKELSENLPNARIALVTGKSQLVFHQQKSEDLNIEDQNQNIDVLVTTIDQLCHDLLVHRRFTELISFFNASLVFDEFHEFFDVPSFFPLFYELTTLKSLCQTQDITLLSGTPNPLFLNFLETFYRNPVACESFNPAKFNVSFSEEKFSKGMVPENVQNNSINIFNYAQTAQYNFLNYPQNQAIPFHGAYLEKDRSALFKDLMSSPNATNPAFPIIFSGPAAQASLNISRKNGVIELSTPENVLQRFGRVNRFGECSEANIKIIAEVERLKKGKNLSYKDAILQLSGNQFLAAHFYFYFQLKNYSLMPESFKDIAKIYDHFYRLLLGNTAVEEEHYQLSIAVVKMFIQKSELDIPELDDHIKSVKTKFDDPKNKTYLSTLWVKAFGKKLNKKQKDSLSSDLFILKRVIFELNNAAEKSLEKTIGDGNKFLKSYEPVKFIQGSKSKKKMVPKLRGSSVSCSALHLKIHYQNDNTVKVSSEGYLHEDNSKNVFSFDEQRLARDLDLLELYLDYLKSTDPKRLKNIKDKAKYGNYSKEDWLLFESNPENPFLMSFAYQSGKIEDISAKDLQYPGSFYVTAVLQDSREVPVGVMRFKEEGAFQELITNLNKQEQTKETEQQVCF
jgi:CRISPR-associated endonuclease/helicase Cas3